MKTGYVIFRNLLFFAAFILLYNTQSSGQSISVTTNGTQTIPISSVSLTSNASSNNTINSIKWTKFSVPGQALKKVTVIGSSTAAGGGVSSGGNAFVNKLRAYYQAQGIASDFVNLSLSGSSPFGYDINTTLNNTTPDILLVCYPSNGYTASLNGVVINQYLEFQNACNSRGIQMIVTGTQPRDDFNPSDRANLVSMNELFRSTFTDHFIDFMTPLLNPNGYIMKNEYRADGIHPNDAGHEVLYQLVKAFNIFQFSSASSASINSPGSLNTNITNMASGIHRFQIGVGDNGGFAASAVAIVTVNGTTPTANAGANQSINLPANQVTLSGSGTVSNGGPITYGWTQISGTAATIASQSSATTNITGLTTAGTRVFRLTVTQSDNQTAFSDVTVTVNPVSISTPYGGTRRTIPGKLEAEEYDNGGQNTAYLDGTAENSGVTFRLTESVDVRICPDAGGGHCIGWTTDGEWVKYSVNVTTTGTYTFTARTATPNTGKSIQFQVDGVTAGTLTVVNTGGFNNWQTVTLTNVSLTAGDHVFRFLFNTGDAFTTTAGFDVNWFNFDLIAAVQPPTVTAGSNQSITLPANQVTLSGSGASNNGGTITYLWTQVSGTTATITSASTASTNITGLTTAGTRVFRLTVTRNDGQTAFSEVTVTVNPVQSSPTASAGSNQSITLPFSQVTLSGSGAANNGGTITYLWTQVSGTSATIASAAAASTNVTGLTTEGTRVFRLTVTRNDGQTAFSEVTVTVSPANTGTSTPYGGTRRTIPGKLEAEEYDNGGQNVAYNDGTIANSGQAFRLTESVDLRNSLDAGNGYAVGWTTDGEWLKYSVNVTTTGLYTFTARIATPNTGKSVQFQVDGVTVGTLTVVNTGGFNNWQTSTLSNVSLTAGDHVFRFLFNTGDASNTATGFDVNWFNFDLTAVVQPPTVTAGNNQSITLPANQVTLSGSGAANNGGTITYAWTQISGTAAVIASASTASTNVTGLTTEGTRVFRLTVTRNDGQTAFSEVTVTVNPVQSSPTVTAGSNQSITLPFSQVTLSGSGAANNGGTLTYLWTQVSGTAAAITNASAASTAVTGLTTAGARVFRLTVTRNDGQTAFSEVTVTVSPANTGTSTPYGGTRRTIPGKLEAEEYDNGGQNIAYNDGTAANSGQAFRLTESVDLRNSLDAGNGYAVGWTTDGEWVKYSVNVTTTGVYNFTARIATPNTGKSVQFQVDGVTVGTLTVVNTGGFNNWQTSTLSNVSLTAGDHVFRFLFNTGDASNTATGFDVNWFNFDLVSQPPTASAGSNQSITLPFSQVTLSGSGAANNGGTITYLWTQVSGTSATITSASTASTTVTGLTTEGTRVFRLTVTRNDGQTAFSEVTVTVSPANTVLSTPYGGTRRTIPGKLEAEEYDNGGQGIAYNDGTIANSGQALRLTESVDLRNSLDGVGYAVGWTTDGEWVKYSVNVTTTGTYTFTARIATPNTGKSIQFQVDGVTVGTLTVVNTGGYNNWQTATLNNVSLTAGDHVFRFLFNTGDASNTATGFDVNWFNFALAAPAVTKLPASVTSEQQEIIAGNLLVSIFPNPASSYFNLKVQAKSIELVTIRIVDMAGKLVQQLQGNPGQAIKFGDNILNGIYFVEVRQGSERVITKIIKQ